MGNNSSASTRSGQKQLSQADHDIQYLANRQPFGDEELHHIYRAYQCLQNMKRGQSFLTDMGVLTFSTSDAISGTVSLATNEEGTDNSKEPSERLVLLQAIEQKILPANFGNRLYQTAFLGANDVSDYSTYIGDVQDNPTEARTSSVPHDEYARVAKLERFFEGLSNCGRRGAKATLKVLIACCQPQTAPSDEGTPDASSYDSFNGTNATNKRKTTWIDALEFVEIGYRVALATAFLQAVARDDEDVGRFLPSEQKEDEKPHVAIQALAKSLKVSARRRRRQTSSTDFVNEDDVLEWAESLAPLFASSLATFTHNIFFPRRPYPPSRTSFDFPRISDESTFFHQSSSPMLFSLGCMSSSLSGEFFRLYTSASDGLSFNRLQNSLLGYGGPTLLIIQSVDCIFGAFTSSSWKESKDFYGNSDCFLFQLLPETAVYRPTGNGLNFMYCNSFARSRGYDQQAHGIGFGGTVDMPRLFISESFDNNVAKDADMTFEKGSLFSGNVDGGKHFEIDHLEVWGVGGDAVVQEALGARTKQREIKHAAIQKARKVDKAQFLDDFKSGLIESKAFAHREQIRGREGACVDPDHENNYIYPEK